MSQELQALLHLVDRGVEGRLLPEEGEQLKRVLTAWDRKLTELSVERFCDVPPGEPKPKLQLPAESF